MNVHMHPQADTATRNNIGFGIGSLVVFGYSFLLASFVLFLVTEKESKVQIYVYVYPHGTLYTLNFTSPYSVLSE